MTQADLNRAVAEVTGESVRHIASLGFGLLAVPRVIGGRRKPRRRRNAGARPHPTSRVFPLTLGA